MLTVELLRGKAGPVPVGDWLGCQLMRGGLLRVLVLMALT